VPAEAQLGPGHGSGGSPSPAAACAIPCGMRPRLPRPAFGGIALAFRRKALDMTENMSSMCISCANMINGYDLLSLHPAILANV